MILSPQRDPMGRAISDCFHRRPLHRLRVLSSRFDEDEMPVSTLFRTEVQMPPLERRALSLARGRVLDVGAGAGCHTLALQARGLTDVTAIDVSPLSVETMQARGVRRALCADFFSDDFGSGFDTLLFMMNGFGIAGRLARLPRLLERARRLLAPGGIVLADSTDLRYLFEEPDGTFLPPAGEGYYGEVDYRMVYGSCKGPRFDWLYVDFETLCAVAAPLGFRVEKVQDGEHYDFLARLEWPGG